jgi:predicted nucleic acid-binding protein
LDLERLADHRAVTDSSLRFDGRTGLGDLVPAVVLAEITTGNGRDGAADSVRTSKVTRVVPDIDVPAQVAVWQVGAGESQVLGWALREPGKVAILDDRATRRCATLLGIPVIGTVGVVALAKRRGLVSAAAPIFTALEEAGLFLSKALIRQVLTDLGEAPGESSP